MSSTIISQFILRILACVEIIKFCEVSSCDSRSTERVCGRAKAKSAVCGVFAARLECAEVLSKLIPLLLLLLHTKDVISRRANARILLVYLLWCERTAATSAKWMELCKYGHCRLGLFVAPEKRLLGTHSNYSLSSSRVQRTLRVKSYSVSFFELFSWKCCTLNK